ncbi:class I SAM-dependent methyltransferase [Erythrobacter sp. YJ-T3-07]|uniref:class I SAM-dependent methyltransferase n=1 Tax=Erythrobacter sp. YJ-T3-07 TaxID=2793063 RepID=UPI0018D38EA3|nr:class I SAM-dependent methyltransferase [Erythrobacter sp. YJ-T3-07]MBH1944492.1 class I SAM-dependent methyltransferase [Erythrobacter sp. YJ-T3-07]
MSARASHSASGFFDQKVADSYDERNSRLAPISDGLHFLMRLTLASLPANARVLCVGVGTGADIFALARARADLTFVGVDPSAEMLEIARHRLNEADIGERCELVHGYVEDVADRDFAAVVSLFVAHFVQREDRPAFYRAIYDRLAPGGRFLSAEISGDLDAPQFPAMVEDWKQVQALMGANEDSLASLGETLRNVLSVIGPAETEALWREAGFAVPVPFFQAFMIRGWHADKPSA